MAVERHRSTQARTARPRSLGKVTVRSATRLPAQAVFASVFRRADTAPITLCRRRLVRQHRSHAHAAVGSRFPWREAVSLPVGLQNSRQDGGPVLVKFVADPRTVRLCMIRNVADTKANLCSQLSSMLEAAICGPKRYVTTGRPRCPMSAALPAGTGSVAGACCWV